MGVSASGNGAENTEQSNASAGQKEADVNDDNDGLSSNAEQADEQSAVNDEQADETSASVDVENPEESDSNAEQANDHVQSNSAEDNSASTWLKVVTAIVAIPPMIFGGWYWWKSRQVPDSTCAKILKAVGFLRRRRLKETSAQRTLGRLLDAMEASP